MFLRAARKWLIKDFPLRGGGNTNVSLEVIENVTEARSRWVAVLRLSVAAGKSKGPLVR